MKVALELYPLAFLIGGALTGAAGFSVRSLVHQYKDDKTDKTYPTFDPRIQSGLPQKH